MSNTATKFKVGQIVKWESLKNGKTYYGKIIKLETMGASIRQGRYEYTTKRETSVFITWPESSAITTRTFERLSRPTK